MTTMDEKKRTIQFMIEHHEKRAAELLKRKTPSKTLIAYHRGKFTAYRNTLRILES